MLPSTCMLHVHPLFLSLFRNPPTSLCAIASSLVASVLRGRPVRSVFHRQCRHSVVVRKTETTTRSGKHISAIRPSTVRESRTPHHLNPHTQTRKHTHKRTLIHRFISCGHFCSWIKSHWKSSFPFGPSGRHRIEFCTRFVVVVLVSALYVSVVLHGRQHKLRVTAVRSRTERAPPWNIDTESISPSAKRPASWRPRHRDSQASRTKSSLSGDCKKIEAFRSTIKDSKSLRKRTKRHGIPAIFTHTSSPPEKAARNSKCWLD